MAYDPKAAAQFIADAHDARANFCNLSGDLEPPAILPYFVAHSSANAA